MHSKLKYITIVFLISTHFLYGQRLIKAENFPINTPFLEPEERVLAQSIGSEGFVYLAKNRGTTKGASIYNLEHRRPDLSVKWSIPLKVSDLENILHLEVVGHQVIVFSVLHNLKQNKKTLHADLYNKSDGQHITEKILLEHSVESWQSMENKGAVARNFNSYILAGSKRGYVTPLEYRYEIGFSPDKSLIFFYRYDYSKPTLLVEAYVFDTDLSIVKKGIFPIDNGYINHGISLSPNGNIYILNAKNDGSVAVVYYDLDEKDSRFLEISPSNSERAHFKISVEDELNALISYTNSKGHLLDGMSFSRFNFAEEKVDWIHFQPLTHMIDSLSESTGEKISRNSFELVHQARASNGILFVLEQKDFQNPGRPYQPGEGDDRDFWRQGKSKLVLGDVLLLFFDNQNVIQWIKAISKNQTSGSEEGMISLGFNLNLSEENVKLLYAVGSGSVSQLNHVTVDWKGIVNTHELPNEHNVILLRPYTIWTSKGEVVLVGKKGAAGKSSMILKYKIP